jgi:hypothetical protein
MCVLSGNSDVNLVDGFSFCFSFCSILYFFFEFRWLNSNFVLVGWFYLGDSQRKIGPKNLEK